MPKSHSAPAARSVPLWIIAGVAVLAGGVGSAAVLAASQFLSEARVPDLQSMAATKAPVAMATVIARPDRQMPKGFVSEAAPAQGRPVQLGENDPRFGVAASSVAKDAFAMVDKSGASDSNEEDEPVTLAALGESQDKPTKTVKKADDEKPKAQKTKASGKVTGRSVTNDDVNIRAGANSRSAVIGVVPANTSVDIVKCASWCEIAYEGKRGYVYSGFLGGGAKTKNTAAPAMAAAKPSDGKVRSSVTLQPKKKWSLFRKNETDTAAEAPTPAFN